MPVHWESRVLTTGPPGRSHNFFFFGFALTTRYMGISGGSDVKNLPARRETQVLSLGCEDTLEKGTATHSIILACRVPRTEEPGGLQSLIKM